MIDLKALRDDPERFIDGARAPRGAAWTSLVCWNSTSSGARCSEQEQLRSEQKKLGKEVGPQLGKLKGQLKGASGDEAAALQTQLAELEARPTELKHRIQSLDESIEAIDPEWHSLQLEIPQPPDADVPRGESADDNVEIRRWAPDGWDWDKSFEANRGFAAKTHLELVDELALVDFERGVKVAGSRSYALTGDGMRLHQAILAMGMHHITQQHGFRATSVPVLVREQAMVGTGFFPGGREQTYRIDTDSTPGPGQELYLTGTGEVGLMSLHADEIIDAEQLPLKYATVSTCFRREARPPRARTRPGWYRIHQFDKVEQVVVCRSR